MDGTQKINFNGGYVELFAPNPPFYELGKWNIKIIGKVIGSDNTTKAEGKRILIDKGFTTNGIKAWEFYKNIRILDDL